MSSKQGLYDIQEYTDNELYDILDLVNPSDRELEAKILMEIHKYENINTKSARKLAIFFDEIYNHFFETEEDVVEGFESDGDGEYASGGNEVSDAKEKYKLRDQDSRDAGQDTKRLYDTDKAKEAAAIENRLANATSSKDFFDSFDTDNATGKEDTAQTVKFRDDREGDSSLKQIGSTEVYNQSNMSPDNFQNSQVGYTRELDYSRGKLNPIMKETTKRIISIDSQYRSDKRTFSTDFTFNLSEPLKDVISLRLYSVQIPYTWYTIGKAYGNNFFYFKGRTPGIDTDYHDIKIEILAGNYKPSELIDTVNSSINVIKASTTDISLGNTQLSYNPNTSLTTSVIDLKKSYNESSYVLNFFEPSTPDEPSIHSYLGFIDTEYNSRNIRSKIDTYNLTDNFNVTENNNYFTINVYQDNSTTVNNSFDISITPNTYTRETLITTVTTALSNETRLTNTNCGISADNTYIDMSLQLARAINGVNSSTKTEVVFYEQQHYTVDFINGLFSGMGSIDIFENIGTGISSIINILVINQLKQTVDALNSSANSNPNGLIGIITDGTYTALETTTNGNGLGATLTVVASGNEITSVTVAFPGTGYMIGDTLTVDKSLLVGRSADLIFTLQSDDFDTNPNPVMVAKEQHIFTIKTKFHNGGINTNYNNAEVIHNIILDNAIAVDYSLSALYSVIESTIKAYQYNGVNIFADTTVSAAGLMTLKINADDKIWTNDNSCFGFENTQNRLNEILSETEATEQSGSYTITTIPYVHLIPNTDMYNDASFNGMNDLSFTIPRFGNKNLTEYIDVINESIRTYDLSNNNVFNTQGNTSFDYTTAYPKGTHAYLQNQLFQMYFDVDKVFDETMYEVDLSGSIFYEILTEGKQVSTMFPGVDQNNRIITDVLEPTYTTTTDFNTYKIKEDTIIFTIRPRLSIYYNTLNGNEKEGDTVFTIGNINYSDDDGNQFTLGADFKNFQVSKIIDLFIRPAIINYKDPLSGKNTFRDIVISQETHPDGTRFNISLQISIKKTLSANNYDVHFKDQDPNGFTWNTNLYISDELTGDNSIDTSSYNIVDMNENYKIYDSSGVLFDISGSEIDSSGNILEVNGNILDVDGTINDVNNGNIQVSGRIIYTVTPEGNVKISGTQKLISQVGLDINRFNNTITIKAIEDGVATTTNQNDVIITLPIGTYFRDTLLAEINNQITQASSTYSNISGTKLELQRIDNKYRIKIVMNIAREYGTSDFNLIFFDDESFATCVSGASSIQNTTWDTTIGWIMGFREYTTYDMSATGTEEDTVVDSVNGNEITIKGDTGLSTNLYNYFLICLDDFNQSHLNDGLITITNSDTTIPLPSYANRSNFVCDPVTGEKVYSVVNDNVTNRLTEKQIYATQVAANSTNQDSSIGTSVSTKSYGSGPFVTDVFGLVPMKISGLQNGSSYVEFGGTLQNQERSYFGPVNINRMSVKLVTDRGNLVDLNKANWSFSLICETLNKLEPGT
jgi:hypothetical protein